MGLPSESTTIQYAPGYQDQAQEIANKFGVSQDQVVESSAISGIGVTVGQDFTSGDTVKKDDSSIVGGANGQTADQQTCQQTFSY